MLNRLILKVTKFQLPPPNRLGTVGKNILGGHHAPPCMSNRVELKNLRMSNVLMGNTNTLYICALYIPSESSPYFTNDIFHDIRDDINKFGALNNPIMLCGDFNARTGNLVDFIPYLGEKQDTQNMNVPTQVNTQRRNSDHEINTHGQKLIELRIENSLRIINGKCIGDPFGKCTFFTTKGGKSLIDYSIVSDLKGASGRKKS